MPGADDKVAAASPPPYPDEEAGKAKPQGAPKYAPQDGPQDGPQEIAQETAQDAAQDPNATAKRWGLEPPEIIRALSAEERAVLEKKMRRKIDLRLLPLIIIMYILNYIDR